jgi:dTDP-4-dehydrorhamnose reductase
MKLCEIPNPPRVVNIAGKEILSRYEFGLAIANIFDLDKSLITPIREIPGAAMRPLKAGLKINFAKKLGLPIYSVYDGLKAMKDEYE